MHSNKKWLIPEQVASDDLPLHDPMEYEYTFYQGVVDGNVDFIQKDCEAENFINMDGKGRLSRNPVTNLKYHFIVTTAIITRNCVAAGMVQEEAYRLSDFYILKLDDCSTLEEINTVHHRMVMDFTKRMQEYQQKNAVSIPVSKCMDYIYSNIQKRITLEDLAEHAKLSPSHISRLFKKELGISVSDYIREKKIEKAKNLLQYSDYSFIEISSYLAFASQSHFIKTFEEYTGMTPKKYRERFYRSNWSTDWKPGSV